jgi:hypothetical protein
VNVVIAEITKEKMVKSVNRADNEILEMVKEVELVYM